MPEKPIAVIVPSYNNDKNYLRNLDSIYSQQYDNYRVLYFDDCSTDNTWQLVHNYLYEPNESKRIKNKFQKIAIQRTSLYRSETNSKQSCHKFIASRLCSDNEIMVFIDGDDWLKHPKVFQIINKVYSQNKPWVTYGSYEIYHGKNKITFPNFCQQVPSSIIKKNKYRKSTFCTSHLKTCYAWLYKQIPIEYILSYNGTFLPFSTDVAEMRCLIELAGKRNKFIPQVLYVYNRINSNLYQTSYLQRRNNDESQLVREHIRDRMIPLKRLNKPIKLGLRLDQPLPSDFLEKVLTIVLGLDLNAHPDILKNLPNFDLKTDTFYHFTSSNSNSSNSNSSNSNYYSELQLRYMINLGIDLFINKLSFKTEESILKRKLYNIVSPISPNNESSYNYTPKIVAISLDNLYLTSEDIAQGFICTKDGYERLDKVVNKNAVLPFTQKIILTYLYM